MHQIAELLKELFNTEVFIEVNPTQMMKTNAIAVWAESRTSAYCLSRALGSVHRDFSTNNI